MRLPRPPSLPVAALLASTLAACASGHGPVALEAKPPPPSVSAPAPMPSASPPRSPCEVAAEQRARVPRLRTEGKLDRTVRVIERADALCPKSAPETWGALVETLTELGRGEDVRRVAGAIEASAEADPAAKAAAKLGRETIAARESQTFDDNAKQAMRKVYIDAAGAREKKEYKEAREGFLRAWSLFGPNGQALWSAGLAAREMGDKAGAQRLFDRAIVDLERAAGKKVVLDTPDGFDSIGGSGYSVSTLGIKAVAWSKDGRFLATATGNVVSIRDRLLNWRETVRLEGHANKVTSLAFSPDDKSVASGSEDWTVRIWSVATGAETHKLVGHSSWISSVAFSPDGKMIASGSADTTARLWDVARERRIHILGGHEKVEVSSIAFSPDGRTLAAGSESQIGWPSADGRLVRLWDVRTGTLVRELSGHTDSVVSVAFSPDGKTVASGSRDSTARLWDVATGRVVHKLEDQGSAVAFSPDGKTLVTGGGPSLRFWNTVTRGEVRRVQASDSVLCLAFSPDSGTLASGLQSDTVSFIDVATGVEARALGGHTPVVLSLAFSPDGKTLAAGTAIKTSLRGGYGEMPREESVRLWNLVTGMGRYRLQRQSGATWGVAFSPDSKWLAASVNTLGAYPFQKDPPASVRLWDVATGVEARRPVMLGGISSDGVAFSPDGQTLATATIGPVFLWDVATGAAGRKLEADEHDRVTRGSVAFSPDGRLLATGARDKVRLWSFATGVLARTFGGDTYEVTSVAFSPDGQTLASGSHDGSVGLWSVPTGVRTRTLARHDQFVTSVAFSRDGKAVASGSGDRTVRLWSVATGAETRKLDGHKGEVTSIAFSPDGRALASASKDGSIRLWTISGAPLLVLRVVAGHDASYVFTPGRSSLIDLLGSEADVAAELPICRVGALSFPFDLCRERFEVPGLMAKVLAGDASYTDP